MGYDGGKGGAGVYQQIINQIPPHHVYIDAFAGHSAVLRYKLPAHTTIAVDADSEVIAYWQHERNGITTVHGDAIAFVRSYPVDTSTFVYCDPPYLMETRSTKRSLYRHEFATVEAHQELLAVLKTLPCAVAISGYMSDLYATELATWRTISYQTMKRSGQVATEHLWMNYPFPLELHDYRYLGSTFRERERIKRKRQRWQNRLASMPDTERYALLAALATVRSAASPEETMPAVVPLPIAH
jgi:DNA adenine methylase